MGHPIRGVQYCPDPLRVHYDFDMGEIAWDQTARLSVVDSPQCGAPKCMELYLGGDRE